MAKSKSKIFAIRSASFLYSLNKQKQKQQDDGSNNYLKRQFIYQELCGRAFLCLACIPR